MDCGGHLGEFLAVLVGVVGAEHEFPTGEQGDAKVRLGPATVAAVLGGQGVLGRVGADAGHARPSLSVDSRSDLFFPSNVARPVNVPTISGVACVGASEDQSPHPP